MAKERSGVLRFIAELLIVFVGVYGAFELNRYQQSNRETDIRHSYFGSFRSELVKLSSDIRVAQRILNREITAFEEALEKGEKPSPKPIDLFFEAPMLITIAGFNDDVFTQLDPGLAASLSGGYDNVQTVSNRVKRFNQICDRLLISNTPIDFYDRNGQLRPQFDWYLRDLKNLQTYLSNLDGMISGGALPAVDSLLKGF